MILSFKPGAQIEVLDGRACRVYKGGGETVFCLVLTSTREEEIARDSNETRARKKAKKYLTQFHGRGRQR